MYKSYTYVSDHTYVKVKKESFDENEKIADDTLNYNNIYLKQESRESNDSGNKATIEFYGIKNEPSDNATIEFYDMNNESGDNIADGSGDNMEEFDYDNLSSNESNASDDDKFECPTCHKEYFNNKDLKSHMEFSHLGIKVECHVCERKYCNTDYLNRHMKRKHPDCFIEKGRNSKARCLRCSQTFNTVSELNKHLDIHLEKRFKCTYCPKNFTSIYSQKRHVGLIHLGLKHQCKMCKASFKDKITLQKHKKRHLGIKPFKCTFCDKTFASKHLRNSHVKVHFKDKKHKCPMCDERFPFQIHVTRHLISHHNGGYLHQSGPGPATGAPHEEFIIPDKVPNEIIIP